LKEDLLIDLQSRLAHQELALEDLDAALRDQQAQLTKLARQLDAALTRLQALTESMPAAESGDERPPHY